MKGRNRTEHMETDGASHRICSNHFIFFCFLRFDSSIGPITKIDETGRVVELSRAPLQIRETTNGGITLAGVTEAEVTSRFISVAWICLSCKWEGSRNMNIHSRCWIFFKADLLLFNIRYRVTECTPHATTKNIAHFI
ncbi:hypothetical protein LXL04_000010 [Taraxacum kok-saghyz]